MLEKHIVGTAFTHCTGKRTKARVGNRKSQYIQQFRFQFKVMCTFFAFLSRSRSLFLSFLFLKCNQTVYNAAAAAAIVQIPNDLKLAKIDKEKEKRPFCLYTKIIYLVRRW